MGVNVSDIKVYKDGAWHSLRGQKVRYGNEWKTFTDGCGVRADNQWYVLASTSIGVVVYVSPSVAENKDGEIYWHLTIGTEPDVLSSYLSDVTITGTIMMSDTSTYTIEVTATGDTPSVNTGIPYVEGIVIQSVELGATLSNSNYYVSEVTFTGMFNL